MQVRRISLTVDEINSIPQQERALLIGLAHAINDINTINKVVAISSRFPHEPKWIAHAQANQSMILARVLHGKLSEAWVLFQNGYLKAKMGLKYDPKISPQAREAMTRLKSYFGKKSLVNTVRNSFAFHYSLPHAGADISEQIGDEDMTIYVHEHLGNSLYSFAEELMTSTLYNEIAPGDPELAASTFFSHLSATVADFNDVANSIIVEVLCSHLGESTIQQRVSILEIEHAPTYDEVSLPFFVDMYPIAVSLKEQSSAKHGMSGEP